MGSHFSDLIGMEMPEIEFLALKGYDDSHGKQKKRLATHGSLSLVFVVFF